MPRQLSAPITAAILMLLAACASIGNPSGGPRDEDPPMFVRSNPAPKATNFKGDRVVLTFDEFINVKDPTTKVVVSPPGKTVPRVSGHGKRVTVEFRDTLLPETTYTIDFSNSIEDNNEGNKLQGFTFTFSTGERIDTLRLSGMVLDAETLEPRQGILVGAYRNLADSAFVKRRFERVAKTDDRGRFTIYGLAPGEYRVYALDDKDNDMRYANPEEDVAFTPMTFTPVAERIETTDTIFNLLTGDIDTVVTRMRTLYTPNDILLRTSNSGRRQQFISKYERQDSTRIRLEFNARQASPPAVDLVGLPGAAASMTVERSLHNDTVTYWLPPALMRIDTLRISVAYHRLDSLLRPVPAIDTLQFITRHPKPAKADKAREKKKDKKDKDGVEDADTAGARRPPSRLAIHMTGSEQHVYAPAVLEFTNPPVHVDTTAFHMEQKSDTVWIPAKARPVFELGDSLQPRRMRMTYPWEYGTQYRLSADTLAVTDMYGNVSDPWKKEFSTRPESDYSSLSLVVRGLPDSIPAYVDLLTSREDVARRTRVKGGRAEMPYLDPGRYYVRVVLDYDGDNQFTPGDFETGRMPDLAFYMPKAVNVRKNWDSEQEWDVFAVNIDEMKPLAIKKNKPERVKGAPSPEEQQEDLDEEQQEERDRMTGNYNPFEDRKTRRKNARR